MGSVMGYGVYIVWASVGPSRVEGQSLGWGVGRSDGVGKLRVKDSIMDSISNPGRVVGRSLGWGVGRSAGVCKLRVIDSISNIGRIVGRSHG